MHAQLEKIQISYAMGLNKGLFQYHEYSNDFNNFKLATRKLVFHSALLIEPARFHKIFPLLAYLYLLIRASLLIGDRRILVQIKNHVTDTLEFR